MVVAASTYPSSVSLVRIPFDGSGPVVLRTESRASVGRDGALTLSVVADGQCRHTTFETLDRSTTSSTPAPCGRAEGAPAAATTRTAPGRTHAWWWPFGDGRPTLEVRGRHTGRLVGGDPLRELRADDVGLTVRDGDMVRRYTWQR